MIFGVFDSKMIVSFNSHLYFSWSSFRSEKAIARNALSFLRPRPHVFGYFWIRNFFFRAVHICYLPAGRSVFGKTVPVVLSTARGRRPRAVLKTEGTVFPNTDRPRPAINLFIFFSLENYFIRNICVDFLLKQFHTVRVRLMFRSSKTVLFTEVFKRRDLVFADFRTEQ